MPRTFEEVTCGRCGGEGIMQCPVCNTTGWAMDKKTGKTISCKDCKGDGWLECVACEGDGKRTKKREIGR